MKKDERIAEIEKAGQYYLERRFIARKSAQQEDVNN